MNRFFNYRLLSRFDHLTTKFLCTKSASLVHDLELDIKKIVKFSSVFGQLHQVAPIFSSTDKELKDFIDKLKSIASNEELINKLDSYVESEENYSKLLSTDIESDVPKLFLSNIAALVYPDLNMWDREVTNQFCVEYISALILSLVHFAQNKGIVAGENPKFSIVIARNHNHFILEFYRSQLLSTAGNYSQLYPSLCEVISFIIRYKNVDTIEYGFLSTLNSTDAAIGARYLDQDSLKELNEADLLVSFDHIDELDKELKAVNTYEKQLAYLTRQIYQSDAQNVANRWFKKPLQFVIILNKWSDKIYANGLLIDKTRIPIATAMEMVDCSVDFLTKFKRSKIDTKSDERLINLHKIGLLQKENEEMVKVTIDEFAKSHYHKLETKTHYDVLHFTDYGQNHLDSINLNADAWVQIAIYRAASMIIDMPVSVVLRTTAEDDAKTSTDVQCLTREMVEYMSDPTSEDKLRIACESNKVFTTLGKKGYSLGNIIKKYQNNLSEILADEGESAQLNELFNHNLTSKLTEPSITIMATPSRYSMSMVASSDFKNFKLPMNLHIHYNISPQQILFNMVDFEGDPIAREKLDMFKDHLIEYLRSLEEVVKS